MISSKLNKNVLFGRRLYLRIKPDFVVSARSISLQSIKLGAAQHAAANDSLKTDTNTLNFSERVATDTVGNGAATISDGSILAKSDGSSADSLQGTYTSMFQTETQNFTTNLTEPAFTELGLGHGWPSGMAQTLMEFFHIDVGLPWWQVIGATTVVLRVFLFPIVVIAQKNMVAMNNHQPQIQKLQVEQQLASIRGETDRAVFMQKALENYFEAHGCHPIKSLWPILTQGFFFTSMFFGLRGMTNIPVESLTSGGIFWFSNLAVADPTFILPVLTSSTIYLQLYLGADGLNTSNVPPIMKKILYALPLISVPVMLQFPAALNLYWLSNNIISVCQASVIRQPGVRAKLGIGEMKKWKPEDLPMTNFTEELKREMQIQRKKREKEELRKKQEKQQRLDKELRKREELLKALDDEDKQRSEKR